MSKKIVLFGGSFDPPHLGHLLIAQWVAELLKSTLRFLPNGVPPHKNPYSASQHRLQMLKLALTGNSNFVIDDSELQSDTYHYTVDTLRYFATQGVAQEDLFFVLGSDSLNSLMSWREPEEIIKLCTLVAFEREPFSTHVLQSLQEQGARLVIATAPILEISSSMIRERIKQGKSIRYLVPDEVRDYILKSRLYKEGK